MRWSRVAGLRAVLAVGLLAGMAPSTSSAFSFSGLDPGDKIVSVILSPTSTAPLIEYTTAGTQLTFIGDVTTLNLLGGAVININPGDVVFSSTLTLVAGSEVFIPGSFTQAAGADFANGLTVDLSIDDIVGATTLLEADYDIPLQFNANNVIAGIVNGTIVGDFTVAGGDAAFVDAFGPTGAMNTLITAFQSNGSAVGEICDMLLTPIPGLCTSVTGFDNWTAAANVTITTTGVPEPGTIWMLGIAAFAIAKQVRRF